MARHEEQESARTEVTEVAPDVLRMELPIRLPGLGHVNCYAITDKDGATLVDPGLPGPGTWRAIQDRLRRADLRVKDIHTVLVTHSHPDHFGGASRLAKESGARVVAHHSFSFGPIGPPEVSVDDLPAEDAPEAEQIDPDIEARPESLIEEHQAPASLRTTPWGGQRQRPPIRVRLRWALTRMLSGLSLVPRITHPMEHGDVLELAGREWFLVHTPGHTTDHICLHDPEHGTFLAGDHVLPTITPHISGFSSSPDPLASFFYSLDRVAEIKGVKQVLPAHGHPFPDLTERAEAIKRHHFERLEKVKAISRELGPSTVAAYSRKLFRPRSWGPMAESETYAHLEHLRLAREAECHRDSEGRLIYVTR